MFKKIALIALFALAAMTTFPSPASAEKPRTFTGRVTARTENTITVYDKELVTVALNDETAVEPWIREKNRLSESRPRSSGRPSRSVPW